MNVQNLRSMIRPCLLFSALLCAAAATAQSPYRQIGLRNLWTGSVNGCSIARDTVTASEATLYGEMEGGGLRTKSAALRQWHAGARAATVTHYGRLSLGGSFGFDHFEGREMCGSMFVEQGFWPVDVIEFTPGRKQRQTYGFDGRIAARAGGGWLLGAQIGFDAVNYAKRKDIRHTNYRQQLAVAPAVQYARPWGAVGLNYIFEKNSESVSAEEIGSNTDTYEAFLDKGLMYGVMEAWTGSGLHLKEAGVDGFPVRELTHGAALQGEWKSLFAEVVWRRGRGVVGEKSYEWFAFPSERFDLRAAWRRVGERATHVVRAEWRWSRLRNEERVVGRETQGGVTRPVIYGSVPVLERRCRSLSARYDGIVRRGEYSVRMAFERQEDLATPLYPERHYRQLDRFEIEASAMRRTGRFEWSAGAAFSVGNNDERDLATAGQLLAEVRSFRLEEYWNAETEYLTAPVYGLSADVKYTLWRGLCVGVGGRWRHGANLKYLPGPNRLTGRVEIAYRF